MSSREDKLVSCIQSFNNLLLLLYCSPQITVRSSILSVASEITDTSLSADPTHSSQSLLKLRDLLRDNTLDSQILQEAYLLIWKCDIIHVIIELLRQDFSTTHGQWYTAVGLARILATVCGALRPKRGVVVTATNAKFGSKSVLDYDKEEVEEYYEILLPTATDSLLILANNINEFEHSSDSSSNNSSVYLDLFEAVTDALIRLCSAHFSCILRVIQSSYLLHLLISDNHTYSMSILNTIQELVKLDEQVIEHLSLDVLQSILDELVYKIGGADKDLAIISLKVLALLSSTSSATFDLISERYRGLSFILQKWSKESMDNSMFKFVTTLLERVKVSDEEYKLYKAAAVIQSTWRGHTTRMKLKRMKRGITKLQRLYRQGKAQKQKYESLKNQGDTVRSDAITKIQTLREQHEHQVAMLEQLPASSVSKYLAEQEGKAAVKIQSWWRGEKDRRKVKKKKAHQKQERSAITIQRAFRRHLKNQNTTLDINDPLLLLSNAYGIQMYGLPPLTAVERGQLQAKVTNHSFSMTNPKSEEHQQQVLNKEMSDLLEWFYSSRIEQREADQRRSFLYTQVHSNLYTNDIMIFMSFPIQLSCQCQQLLNMVSLSSSVKETSSQFTSGSRAVGVMAERAHKEELVSMNLPWWKREYERDEIEL